MNNLFKNIYFKLFIFILIIILFIIIYYLSSKKYDKFYSEDESVVNAKIYMENSDSDIQFDITKPDLGKTGPIKFVDAQNTSIVLGKYPNNWTEKELVDLNLTETIIKIPRGADGDKGDKGDTATFNHNGTLSLQEINSDNLKINADNLNLNTKKIHLNDSLCFGDTNHYCIDKNFISYLKDTDNLIQEKTTVTNLLDSKNTELENCNRDLSNIRKDMDENYFSKVQDVPSIYTLTQTCDLEKQALANLYAGITDADELKTQYESILTEKENLLAQNAAKETIINQKISDIETCNSEKSSLNTENVNLRAQIKVLEEQKYSAEQNFEDCNSKKNTVNLDDYISRTDHSTILYNDYIRKDDVASSYTLNSHLDTSFKDVFGNYLTREYVEANYYNKAIKDASSEIECQTKIESALSDPDAYHAQESIPIDIRLSQLESLYTQKLTTNKNNLDECINDKDTNYYSKEYIDTYYRNLSDIQTNYVLKTDCDRTTTDDYILKTTVDTDYIKMDDYFKNNYVTKTDYDTLNSSLTQCNTEKGLKDNEKLELSTTITELETTIQNMNCTDCEEYTRGVNQLLTTCQSDKEAAVTQATELREDIKKLGDFITGLYSNIESNQIEITKLSTELEQKDSSIDKDVQYLQGQVNAMSGDIEHKDTAITAYELQIQKLNKERNDAAEIISRLQTNIQNSESAIQLTQEELYSKLSQLQEASKQIDKCIEMEKEYNSDKAKISQLQGDLSEWELKARGQSAAAAEIDDLDFKLRTALWDKQNFGTTEYTRGRKDGKEAAKKIWKYTLYDLTDQWNDGWTKGKNLATVGNEEEFLKETCKAEFDKGVASRQEFLYTDDDMKEQILKAQSEIGNKLPEPQQCLSTPTT